jgi:hypothetical protein
LGAGRGFRTFLDRLCLRHMGIGLVIPRTSLHRWRNRLGSSRPGLGPSRRGVRVLSMAVHGERLCRPRLGSPLDKSRNKHQTSSRDVRRGVLACTQPRIPHTGGSAPVYSKTGRISPGGGDLTNSTRRKRLDSHVSRHTRPWGSWPAEWLPHRQPRWEWKAGRSGSGPASATEEGCP